MKEFEITIHPHGQPLAASYTFIWALNAGLARRAIAKELGRDAHKFYILARAVDADRPARLALDMA